MIFVCFIFAIPFSVFAKQKISMNNNNISLNGGKNGSDKLVVSLVCLTIAKEYYLKRKYVPIYRNDFSLVGIE